MTLHRDQAGGVLYRLGLDLGVESVGWAVLLLDKDEPRRIAACGVHTFDAGVEGDIEAGRESSRNAARRQARQMRRQLWRRRRRRQRVLRLLQRGGLLPPGDVSTPDAIQAYLRKIDAELSAANQSLIGDDAALLPYQLRAAALDRELKPVELGRALYHLAQRRGFKSNRKSAPRKNEEPGQIKQEISALRTEMATAGARTFGEYVAGLNPRATRVRRRHTDRSMFIEEFERILDAQADHHRGLNADFRKRLYDALFFQRPIKNQSHLIGTCELMPRRRRAPMALRVAQQFRLLQRLNDLMIEPMGAPARSLTDEERAKLLEALTFDGDMKFKAVRKLLNLEETTRFNLERGGEERMPGNRTESRLAKLFGARWAGLTGAERDAVVEDLLTFEDEAALERRARGHWGLDADAAAALAGTVLEPGYASHCREALERLVGRMADGTPYATARRELFPERFASCTAVEKLPAVKCVIPKLRNPAVCRVLTEMRKVVNAIIARFGKPQTIHVELARDLRNPRKRREELAKRMRARQRERERAAARIVAETHVPAPSRSDIERVLLADECGWHCPYTGRPIQMATLVGDSPEFDVEHIIPLSRSLDDSFANKTLCFHEENRSRKRNHTPFEAYAADTQRWEAILARVRKFNGPFARAKLQRFLMDEQQFEELYREFTQRQLNDTRYASRLAAEYLSCLYGGRADDERQRIFVSPGNVTAFLRGEWGLNGILGLAGEKNRDDHRHHAVDALVIALSDARSVKALSEAAERADREGRRRFGRMSTPWTGFLEEAQTQIGQVIVSRRVNHRLRGLLHAESLYSKAIPGVAGDAVRHIRKELHKLTPTEAAGDAIVDPVVRRRVQERLAELGLPPDKAFADPANHPWLPTRDGRRIPIHKVRVRARVKPWPVGQGVRQRHVAAKSGTNLFSEIVATINRDGTETWSDHCVSRFEALERKQRGEPIVRKDWGAGKRLVFALWPDDTVEMADDAGIRRVYRVVSISQGDIEFRLHCDARTSQEVRNSRLRASSARFWSSRAVKKVRVSHLGEVLPANG